MPDFAYALIGGLVTLIVAVVSWFAGVDLWRRKQRADQKNALRVASAEWLTKEGLLYRRILSTCESLAGFPKDRKKHLEAVANVEKLMNEMEAFISATNNLYMIEKDSERREILDVILDACWYAGDSLQFAAGHYTENLEFHEYFDETLKQDKWHFPRQSREEWRNQKKRFEEHDSTCPFKSDDFKSELASVVERTHNLALKYREVLARSISE